MKFNVDLLKTFYYRLIFSATLLLGICTITYAQNQLEPIKSSVAAANYKIGVGDVLKIIIPKQTILSLDAVRVNNEGTIRMPLIDEDISAACLTEVELADVLNQKYKKYILNPQVYVAVQEFHSNPVALLGAVNAPGRFDIQRPTRLLELLTFVNGPSPNAGSSIQIIRQPNANQCEKTESVKNQAGENEDVIFLPLAETLKGSENANPFLQGGDIISIAAADEPDEAYIIGNVKSAMPVKLKEPITISRAIAMAGGPTKDAKTNKIKISRQDPKTLSKTEIIVNLEEINKDNQKDILLQANDIVDVPGPKPSVLGSILKRAVPILSRGIIPFPY